MEGWFKFFRMLNSCLNGSTLAGEKSPLAGFKSLSAQRPVGPSTR